MKNTILLIDDDSNLNRVTQFQLEEHDYAVTTALNGREGLQKFRQQSPHIIITDLQMPEMSGMELIQEIRKIDKNVIIIIITAYGSVDNAVKACKIGADEYITKPFGIEELIFIIEKTLRFREILIQNQYLKSEIKEKYDFENIIGTSLEMKEIFHLIEQVAPTDSTVLIVGETGTGKELIARAIHNKSLRKDKNFVPVNCAAIPDTLIESELFGHVKGAFTGALKDRTGKFQLAHRGTIFLDEIGDLNYEVQAKLLRTLQEHEIERVGKSRPVKVDVRIIAATNRNLEKLINEKKFREDLYYRINVIPVSIPPLRERKSDIPLLLEHFNRKIAPQKIFTFSEEALEIMKNYNWPGNIRELENLVERFAVLHHEGEIKAEDLPLSRTKISGQGASFDFIGEGMSLEELEKNAIRAALEKSRGNQSEAARLLKIPRHVLVYRMKKYGMQT